LILQAEGDFKTLHRQVEELRPKAEALEALRVGAMRKGDIRLSRGCGSMGMLKVLVHVMMIAIYQWDP
jgi:hypothetical protein